MNMKIVSLALAFALVGCSAGKVSSPQERPRTVEYLSLSVGACSTGGDDFGGDAVWDMSGCEGVGSYFDNQSFSTTVADSLTAFSSPFGSPAQRVYFVHTQYHQGNYSRYVRGSAGTLFANVDAVLIIGFVGWCQPGVTRAACEQYAWANGYFHDEPRLCVQNPSTPAATCQLGSGGVAFQELAANEALWLSAGATGRSCAVPSNYAFGECAPPP